MQLQTIADITGTGAAVSLSAASVTPVRWLKISAPAANSASVRIGDSNVSATRGVELVKGTTIEIPLDGGDVTNRYALGSIWAYIGNNDKISVTYGS